MIVNDQSFILPFFSKLSVIVFLYFGDLLSKCSLHIHVCFF